MNSLLLKVATSPADLQEVLRLRYEVLCKPWNQNTDTATDELEPHCTSILACADDEPAGTLRVHFNNSHDVQVCFMAVSAAYQKAGIGTALLLFAEKMVKPHGIQRVTLNAREGSVKFFRKTGFEVMAPTYLLWGSIPHFVMQKKLVGMNGST